MADSTLFTAAALGWAFVLVLFLRWSGEEKRHRRTKNLLRATTAALERAKFLLELKDISLKTYQNLEEARLEALLAHQEFIQRLVPYTPSWAGYVIGAKETIQYAVKVFARFPESGRSHSRH